MPPPATNDVILAHPTGNQFFRHLAQTLRDDRRLAEACTCIDWRGAAGLERGLPRGVVDELGRRSFSRELGVPVSSRPWREMARLAASRLGWSGLTRHETGAFSVDAVYRDFDGWVARRIERNERGAAVYAYEDASLATFEAAQRRGWRRIYDLPIAYWETSRQLLEEEAARWPEWEPTLIGTRDSAAKHARKTRELDLAECVVCPSRFVADSLPAGARRDKRVVIAPFGSPSTATASAPHSRGGGRLRVLFAGSMTQRKGLADLFAAMQAAGGRGIELVVLGTPIAAMEFYRRKLSGFIHEPTRPHAEVLRLMQTCDVLCLPSIVEGRALVVQEAMSAGLPVIITANTGADDVVEEGRSGFVVPIRSPDAIADRLVWCAEHRAQVSEMGREARSAAARFTWEHYGRTILNALAQMDIAPRPAPATKCSLQ